LSDDPDDYPDIALFRSVQDKVKDIKSTLRSLGLNLYPKRKKQYIMNSEELNNSQNDWIKWEGGECPVDKDLMVEFEFADGDLGVDYAFELSWAHKWDDGNIVAYRVVN